MIPATGVQAVLPAPAEPKADPAIPAQTMKAIASRGVEKLACAQEVFPQDGHGGRTGRREAERRAAFAGGTGVLPVARTDRRHAHGMALGGSDARFLERHVREHHPEIMHRQQQQGRTDRRAERPGVRRG